MRLQVTRKHVVGASAAAILAVSLIAPFEGLRTHAYRDPVGIVTVCYGETRGVHMGDSHTVNECKDMLANGLSPYESAVDRCVHVPLSDSRKAALISFAYNLGPAGFCRSSVVRRLNAGDPRACDSLMSYNRARGEVLPGLTHRRLIERQYCMR